MFVVNTTSATERTSSFDAPTSSPRKRVPSSRRRNPERPGVPFGLVFNVGGYGFFFVVAGAFVPAVGAGVVAGAAVVGSGVTGRFVAAGRFAGAGAFGNA